MEFLNFQYTVKLSEALCKHVYEDYRLQVTNDVACRIHKCLEEWKTGVYNKLSSSLYPPKDIYYYENEDETEDEDEDEDIEFVFNLDFSLQKLKGIISIDPILNELATWHCDDCVCKADYEEFFTILSSWLKDCITRWETYRVDYILQKFNALMSDDSTKIQL